jgi:hypothetical protein
VSSVDGPGGISGEGSGASVKPQQALLSRLWSAADIQALWRRLLAVCDWRDWRAREGEWWMGSLWQEHIYHNTTRCFCT